MLRTWAAEVEGSGVRILSVDPGDMDTRMHADALPDADRSTLTQPAEAAAAIVELIEHCESVPNGARVEAAKWEQLA